MRKSLADTELDHGRQSMSHARRAGMVGTMDLRGFSGDGDEVIRRRHEGPCWQPFTKQSGHRNQ
jgi:hypothetical protein